MDGEGGGDVGRGGRGRKTDRKRVGKANGERGGGESRNAGRKRSGRGRERKRESGSGKPRGGPVLDGYGTKKLVDGCGGTGSNHQASECRILTMRPR